MRSSDPGMKNSLGRVPLTRDREGRPFDWQRLTGKIMRVHYSRREPGSAHLAVFYRGLWFYIDDADLDSKATFSFLTQVLELQSGEIKSAAPVLTLPTKPPPPSMRNLPFHTAWGGSQTSDLISESAVGRSVMERRQWVAVCSAAVTPGWRAMSAQGG